ncbi:MULTISPECIES: NAD(P)-dependent oxidoreductase [unclassified Gemella]|uniref:NAD(P)-dependent oxidoreductase n=1 Tax=unclassified Gemella TaxID=2624949 RepID=UPI001C05A185|nr:MULTISPECIES: NAD(P)-dependent oxidoreductase [unclassified Gemella]MBU0279026.1 NAD(P)-dependent oxidoreductase [Gemella sp. zg-1178]QWQ39098.1 NAD(P)-dependent oxidoreductase [Gemella sp. zg-570]
MKIAWIGVGVMGESLVNHLLNADHEVFVYNRTQSKCANVVKNGAILLEKISDAPKFADIIFTMVGYPKDVEEVYLGENGLITEAKENQIFIDMTTSSPTLAEKINAEFLKKNAHTFDIPVTGGDIGAKNGTLTVFVGGDKKIFEEKVYKLIQTFCKTIEYFGTTGKGQYAKLGNQIAIATTMISLAESYKFAKETGLDTDLFLKTISTGSAGSFSMSSYGPRILEEDYKPGFFIHHFIKDMRLALEECQKLNLLLPGLELVYEMYNYLKDEVKYNEGTQAIIKYYE